VSHLTISRRTLRKRCAAPRCRVRFAQVKSVVATFAAVVSLVVIGAPVVTAQGSVSIEYRSKATFLATFPSFVDWPDGAFASPTAPFIVCVLGDFHFGTTLAEVSRDSLPHGRRFSVRWVRNDQQLRGCHILFVSSSELSRYAKVIALVQGAGTFTVGETAGFLAAGGMLSMSFEHEAVQFEVNLASAKEAHFRVSSRLLALARHVVESTESTKS
jgi:YfiR/HmsC-like